MANDRTPKHKRIKRADTGRDEWKLKAIERREENEKLKYELKSKEDLLLKAQNQIQKLESKLSFEKEKISEQNLLIENLKKSLLDDGDKPYHHRFPTKLIKLVIDLYGYATIACRKISRVLEVLLKNENLSAPHHTTVRLWVIRYGCHQLQTPLKIANDWILIGDVTIGVGKLKCLATLGVRMSALKYRDNLTLTHKDMEILGLYPTESSTGEFVERAFEDSAKRIGGNFLAVVLDQGSDVKKGARLFQANHPNTKILHDIAHKLSNIMEHELEHDVQWFKYVQQLNFTRRQVFQTELAALMPKKQR